MVYNCLKRMWCVGFLTKERCVEGYHCYFQYAEEWTIKILKEEQTTYNISAIFQIFNSKA